MKIKYSRAAVAKTEVNFSSSMLSHLIDISNGGLSSVRARVSTGLTLSKFVIFVCLVLCLQTVFAQSKCTKNSYGFSECDLSVGLLEGYDRNSEAAGEWAWQISSVEQAQIKRQLQHFSDLWCEATLGKSSIRRISIYKDYRKYSSDITLYKSSGDSYSYAGAFPKLNPSIVAFYGDPQNPDNADPSLGIKLVPLFANAALKMYVEYANPKVNVAPSCQTPLASDQPRETVMNDPTIYTRFSYPGDYLDTPPAQTAQYRCYGESAWDVLLQPKNCDSNLSLTIKADLPRQDYLAVESQCSPSTPSLNAFENAKRNEMVNVCFKRRILEQEINFLSGSANTVLIADSDMQQDAKIMFAKAMEETLEVLEFATSMKKAQGMIFGTIEESTAKLAMVDFNDDDAATLMEITADNMDIMSEELDNIVTDQSTKAKSMDDALNVAKKIFSEDSDALDNDYNVVLIVSDTESMPTSSTIGFFQNENIPIYTVGIGKAVNPGLKMASVETGGEYRTVLPQSDTQMLTGLMSQIPTIRLSAKRGTITLENSESIELVVTIPTNLRYDHFIHLLSNNELDIVARMPDDTVSNDIREVVDSDLNIHYLISTPVGGEWKITVTGSGTLMYSILTVSDHGSPSTVYNPISVQVNAGPDLMPRATTATTISYPEPMLITARVQGDMPVLNAQVNAQITPFNVASASLSLAQPVVPLEVILMDNGEVPDAVGADGIYSGIVRDYHEYGYGVYSIAVTASNPEGYAVLDGSGTPSSPGVQLPTVRSAPMFDDRYYSEVAVSQIVYPAPDTDYRDAVAIPDDGTPVRGVIIAVGMVNWYRFKASDTGLYYIQVSNLEHAGPMEVEANLELYLGRDEMDPLSLDSATQISQTNPSDIRQSLVKGRDYFVSVDFVGHGRGSYVLTVNRNTSLLSSFQIAQENNRNDLSSGGGGGSTNYLLLVLLFIALAAFYLSMHPHLIKRSASLKRVVFIRSVVLKFAILLCLTLCASMSFAQSKCVKDDSGILLCDLSISLIQKEIIDPDTVVERAWQATSAERAQISNHLQQFSELWCETTLGKSRIREVSVYTDYKKSSTDVALYRGIGRSKAALGTFPIFKPSITLYYAGLYNSNTVDPYLGRVLTHEFAHAALKIYDEYIEPGVNSSPNCLNPLASDNPRRTIMNNHIVYTRFSHPLDYAIAPPPQTAQYRCYSESAWDVLLQPTGCDSTLSMNINAWFPRQDYFATESSCTPTIPSINRLENPQSNSAVIDCINNTREEFNIHFLPDSENIMMIIDSNLDRESKTMLLEAIQSIMDTILSDHTTRTLAIMDFNDDNSPGFIEATQDNKAIFIQKLNKIMNEASSESNNMNEMLNTAKKSFSANLETIRKNHNEVVVISDTTTMPSASTLRFFDEHNIPVHTVGIGETTNLGLRMLSMTTGGDYYTVSSQDEPELPSDLMRQSFAFASFPETFENHYFKLEKDENEMLQWSVPQDALSIFFGLGWHHGDDGVSSITIRDPDNTVVNAQPIEFERMVQYMIDDPKQGPWNVSITGSGFFEYILVILVPFGVDAHAGTDLMPRANTEPTIVYPEPMMIMARVHGDMAVLNAQVMAEISTPDDDAEPLQLELLDDGEAPDMVSGDGVYSGVMQNYDDHGDGIHTIKVIASNPDGRAVLSNSGVATFATTYHEVARQAPSFVSTKYTQVEVIGTQVEPSNDNHNQPLDIEANGMLIWRGANLRGSTDWFRFMSDRDGVYYIEISNVQGFTGPEPVIDIRLYEADPDGGDPIFLASGIRYYGTNNSSIEVPLEAGKEYLISANNTSNYDGLYALTVGFGFSLLSGFEIARAENGGNNNTISGGGGGSTDYLLFALLLAVLSTRIMRECARNYTFA